MKATAECPAAAAALAVATPACCRRRRRRDDQGRLHGLPRQVDKKVVGPSFKDIAAKYKGQADIVPKLMEKVRKGGSACGAWCRWRRTAGQDQRRRPAGRDPEDPGDNLIGACHHAPRPAAGAVRLAAPSLAPLDAQRRRHRRRSAPAGAGAVCGRTAGRAMDAPDRRPGPPLTRQALAERPLESIVATTLYGRPGTPMPGWKPHAQRRRRGLDRRSPCAPAFRPRAAMTPTVMMMSMMAPSPGARIGRCTFAGSCSPGCATAAPPPAAATWASSSGARTGR